MNFLAIFAEFSVRIGFLAILCTSRIEYISFADNEIPNTTNTTNLLYLGNKYKYYL